MAFLAFWEHANLEAVFHSDNWVGLAQYWLGWTSKIREVDLYSHPPVFPVFCMLLFKICRTADPFLIRIADVLLSAGSCVLIGQWAGRWVDRKTAYWVGAVTVVAPSLTFFSVHLQSESIFVAIEIGFFLLLTRTQQLSKGRALGLGLAAGITSLTRSVFMIFLPFLVLSLFIQARARRAPLFPLVFLVVGWCALPFAWGVRNLYVVHRFIPLTANLGTALYDGIASGPVERFDRIQEKYRELEPLHLSWPDQDRYVLRKGLNYVASHPAQYAKLLAVKLVRFWRPWPYPPYPARLRLLLGCFYTVLFALSVVGVYLLRPRALAMLPVYSYFACLTLTHTVLDTTLRYRVPLEPFLCFFAGTGLSFLVRRLTKKKDRRQYGPLNWPPKPGIPQRRESDRRIPALVN